MTEQEIEAGSTQESASEADILRNEADNFDVDHDKSVTERAAADSSKEADGKVPEPKEVDAGAPSGEEKATSPESRAGEKPTGEQGKETQDGKSDYERAKANKEWQRQEKARKRLEQREAQLTARERQLVEAAQRANAAPDRAPRFGVEQLMQARDNFIKEARKLYREGDIEAADEKMEFASKAEEEANTNYQIEVQERETQTAQESQRLWYANAAEVVKDHPEYEDVESEEFAEMSELLQDKPFLFSYPEGFQDAFEVLEMRKSHARVSGLEAENKKLQEEVDRLRKLNSPEGESHGAGHGKPTDFSKLPLNKQRDMLRRDADKVDS